MLRRLACALLLCLALGACRQTKIDDPTLITGGGSVAVLESHFVSSGDSQAAVGAGNVTYIVSSVELTNDTIGALVPVISHFFLTDRSGNRYFGIDSGTSAFAGISNDTTALKPGEKRKLVVGFRADATTMGTIRYDY